MNRVNRHPRNASPWLLRDRVPAPRGALVAATLLLLLLLLLHHGTIRLSVGSLIGSIMEQNDAKCCTRILCKGKGRKNLNKINKETGISNFEPIDGGFSFHFFPRGPGKSKRWSLDCFMYLEARSAGVDTLKMSESKGAKPSHAGPRSNASRSPNAVTETLWKDYVRS